MPESDVEKAIAPLVRSIDQLYNEMRRIADKLDGYMTRSEYEPRHKALQDDIEKLDERLEKREEAAKAHLLMAICAFGGAILSIAASFILHFLK